MPATRNFLFVPSPNVGILDSWLPVLHRLVTEPGVRIRAFLPRPQATLNLRRGEFMASNSAILFESVHFGTSDAQWPGLILVIRRNYFEGDRGGFERTPGKSGQQNEWSGAVQHSMEIGMGCTYAVTLNSSLAIDMAAMDVPVIDLIRYSSLREDSPGIRFDDHARPFGMFCFDGIAAESRDDDHFSAAVDRITNQPTTFRLEPRRTYKTLYEESTGCVNRSANRILEDSNP